MKKSVSVILIVLALVLSAVGLAACDLDLDIWEDEVHEHAVRMVEGQDATCTEEGYSAYWQCAICGKIFRDETAAEEIDFDEVVIAAKGHEWSETGDTATCTEAGEKTFTCDVCGEIKTEEVEAKGHEWNLTDEKDPTCTEAGEKTFTCDVCGETKTEEGEAALGHELKNHPAQEPQVGVDGNDEYWECTRCGKFFSADKEREIEKEEWFRPALPTPTYAVDVQVNNLFEGDTTASDEIVEVTVEGEAVEDLFEEGTEVVVTLKLNEAYGLVSVLVGGEDGKDVTAELVYANGSYTYTFTIAAETNITVNVSKRLDVFHQPLNPNASFSWKLGNNPGEGSIDYPWEIRGTSTEKAPYWDDVKLHIYDTTGIDDVQTHDFMQDVPFATYDISIETWGNHAAWKDILATIQSAWMDRVKNVEDPQYTFTFAFAMQVMPNAAAAEMGYLESLLNYAFKDGARQTYTVVYTKDDLRLDVFHQAINTSASFTWNLGGNPGEGNIDYAWEILGTSSQKAPYWDDVKIRIYDATGIENIQAHDFMQDTPFATHLITERGGVSWKAILATIQNAWVERARSGEELQDTFIFVFAMQVTPNAAAAEKGYIESLLNYASKDGARQAFSHTFNRADVTATNASQFDFAGNANYLTFLREQGNNGSAFTVYGAAYVVLEIKNKDGRTATAYIFCEEGESGKTLSLYANVEKTGDSLNLHSLTDGNCTVGDFNNWVKNAFGWEDFEIKDAAWSVSTQIHVSETSSYLFDGEWSDPVSYDGRWETKS